MTERTHPYLFVVGCPRSGTTLLQRMLDHHPDLAVANDTHFVGRAIEKFAPQWLERARAGEPVPLTATLLDGVRGYHRFGRLGLDRKQVDHAAAGAGTYQRFVGRLYALFAAERGKRLGGEKTPDFVRRLPLVCGMFPKTRTIHIIRDGRDVALSLLQWANGKRGPGKMELWGREPVAVAALWWRWQVLSGRVSGRGLGAARYREVRYEDLVAQPETELRSLVDFLDLPYSDAMARYHQGKVKLEPGLSAKSAWLPPTPKLRDWRTQMRDRDVELFEALAGDVLEDLAFDRSGERTSNAVAGTARECNEWWHGMLERRETKARKRLARVLARRRVGAGG